MPNGSGEAKAIKEVTRLDSAVLRIEEAVGQVCSLKNRAIGLNAAVYGPMPESVSPSTPDKTQTSSLAERLEDAAEKILSYTVEAKEIINAIA